MFPLPQHHQWHQDFPVLPSSPSLLTMMTPMTILQQAEVLACTALSMRVLWCPPPVDGGSHGRGLIFTSTPIPHEGRFFTSRDMSPAPSSSLGVPPSGGQVGFLQGGPSYLMFCINSVNIDSIECIRDPCLVLTVLTYIVLMVWFESPQSQLFKTFFGLKIS